LSLARTRFSSSSKMVVRRLSAAEMWWSPDLNERKIIRIPP
jgi:hypothetical protein